MNLLEQYIDNMNKWDSTGISNLFCEDGTFDDESAKLLTGEPGYFEGRATIKAVFDKMFAAKPQATILKMEPDGKRMEYDILIMGKTLPCVGIIEEEKDGMFKVYACRPRV